MNDNEKIMEREKGGELEIRRMMLAEKRAMELYAAHRGCLDPKEAACMAAHVYGKYPDSILMGGWAPDASLDGVLEYQRDELDSAVYSRVNDGVKEYAYVFTGTQNDNILDWVNNFEQMVGLSPDYAHSVENARRLSSAVGEARLFFVGHSKGGGQASLCSLSTGRPAVVFNPAPLSNLTSILRKKMSYRNAHIDAYVAPLDPLYVINESLKSGVKPKIKGLRSILLMLAIKGIQLDIPGEVHVLDFNDTAVSPFEHHSMKAILAHFGIKASL